MSGNLTIGDIEADEEGYGNSKNGDDGSHVDCCAGHSFCKLIPTSGGGPLLYAWEGSRYVCHAAEGRTGGFQKMLSKHS